MASAASGPTMLETLQKVFTTLDEPVQEYLAGLLSENPVTNVDEV
jgi:hypothetical protein